MPLPVASGDSFVSISSTSPPSPAIQQNPSPATPMDPLRPTDFGSFVIQVLARSKRDSPALDQGVLRQCLGLSSSFLVTDSTTNPETGGNTWATGFKRLVDVLVALHARDELELETVSAASKACSECWSVSGSWKGLEPCRDGVRAVATKLKTLLDSNGRTYRGQAVYAP